METNSNADIRRGDIYYYDFGENPGSVQCGVRPVLVLQADNFNRSAPTVIVAAVTSVLKKQYLASHVLLPENTGLTRTSMVLVEQLRSVNKADLVEYIGFVKDENTWKNINIAIKKTFGLWFYNINRTGDIRCLCYKCARDYMDNPSYSIRRLDPYQESRDTCDKCTRLGYDYVVYDKKTVRR